MSYEANLAALGHTITPLEKLDNGKFVQAVRTGNLVYTAGCVSAWQGVEIKGKLGGDLSVAEGYTAARYCALNNLRAIKTVIGSLDHVVRFVKVLGMVNVAPGFDNTPAVIHGCSEFLREVFGEAGRHARSAVGMTIPFNYAVEIEMVVEVGD
jgi:enamine deaminase RidA (YjgF/YER057c/UK114 family)